MKQTWDNIKSFSQHGQDIIALSWLRKIGFSNKVAVEFGAKNGVHFSNIRMFETLNWKLYQWDKNFQNEFVNKEMISAENINEIFEKNEVPKQFDFLSIDIDSNDYWVWKALNYEANLVLIEYNPNFSIDKSVALKYDPNRIWENKNIAFSASFSAMVKLGKEKGYIPIDHLGHDILFIKRSLLKIEEIESININPELPKFIHNQTGYDEFIEV
jgi:hypothetical protein